MAFFHSRTHCGKLDRVEDVRSGCLKNELCTDCTRITLGRVSGLLTQTTIGFEEDSSTGFLNRVETVKRT